MRRRARFVKVSFPEESFLEALPALHQPALVLKIPRVVSCQLAKINLCLETTCLSQPISPLHTSSLGLSQRAQRAFFPETEEDPEVFPYHEMVCSATQTSLRVDSTSPNSIR